VKLLMISNLFPPEVLGGYELLAADVADGLRAAGHTVDVLTTGTPHRNDPEWVTRDLRLSRAFGTAPRRDRLRHLVAATHNGRSTRAWLARHGRPDVVLAMSQRRLGLEPLRVLATDGVPLVATVNDDWPVAYAAPRNPRLGPFEELTNRCLCKHLWRDLRFADALYVSHATRRMVRERVPQLPGGRVLYQGVDLRRFSPGPERPIADPVQLLFVGRLHPSKAPDVAIDVLASLQHRGLDARLTLAGETSDSAYRHELEQRAARLGVTAKVRWTGQLARSALPRFYQQSDVLLFLSRWDEPAGLTHLEAMACGLPVVGHARGGAAELWNMSNAAVHVSTLKGPAIADAVERLASAPRRRMRLRDRGLRFVSGPASLANYLRGLERSLQVAAKHGEGMLLDARRCPAPPLRPNTLMQQPTTP
jgi:glycosyltransferase involved in cell wall biosynthesis